MHVISQNIDGGATEADGGASAPVDPSVAMPLLTVAIRNLERLTTNQVYGWQILLYLLVCIFYVLH